MIFAEIANALILVWSHKTARIFLLLIIFVSLLLSIFFSIFSSVIILSCYLSGCIVSFCLVKYQYEVGFCLHRLVSIYHSHLTPKRKTEKGCNICDDVNCNRHQSNIIKEPWKDINISSELNEAVENFYNQILENFILSWYTSLTDDKTFTNELRVSIRYATSTIINRYNNIDLGKLITNKLIPCTTQHIYDCLKIEEKAKNEKRQLEKVAVEYFGKRLHAAVTNRQNELEYLRHLSSCLLPHILPKSEFKCSNFNNLIREILSGWVLLPLMDCIADPNVLNLLLNITVEYKKKHHVRTKQRIKGQVNYLHNFNNYSNEVNAALGQDLSKILKSPEMLYSFMQFLKEEGPVNVLQFCLDIEEFNRKLLTPELSSAELEKLHVEATQIYEVYIKENSVDSIDCPVDVRNHLYYLLQTGAHNVTKLRTSTPLYMAYDYAFSELETKWLPLFYHSEEFYKLVCGSRISSTYHKSANSSPMHIPGSPNKFRKKYTDSGGQGTVSKISNSFNKIKGALKPQPIEGSAVYQSDTHNFETVPSLFIEPSIYRDLSTWRVSIGNVEHLPGAKSITIFHINVKRIDVCSENERSWSVQRQDQDFYTLKIKLVEFHGENEICDSPLPSRRSSTPIETRRLKYEDFLQKLLQKPSLRGSDLLHTFLTTEHNFTLFADNSMPLVSDLGNIYQSVTHKLRKEKGQHLDSFMSIFLQSTETEKSKTNFEYPDVGEEPDTGIVVESHTKTRNLNSSIFGDNFGVPFPEESTYTQMTFRPFDIIQCFSYLLRNIFNVPQGVLRLFLAICNVAHDAVEYLARIVIEYQIKSNLTQHTLAHLICLLKEILFIQKFTPPTKYELEQRKILAFNNLAKMKKGLITYLLGIEASKGLTTLLQIVQSPQLNKQLAYTLFDIIIIELYPDCNLNKSVKMLKQY